MRRSRLKGQENSDYSRSKYDDTTMTRPDNGSDTPKASRTIPIANHFRQLGNTSFQSVLLSAIESLTGTRKRTRAPRTLRIKEISLILKRMLTKSFRHKDQQLFAHNSEEANLIFWLWEPIFWLVAGNREALSQQPL